MKTPRIPPTPSINPRQDPTLNQFLQHTRLLFQRRMPDGSIESSTISISALRGLEVSESTWAEWEAANGPAG